MSFLEALAEKVLIFDGAMGTQIHNANLSLDDYWGQENNSEVLLLSRPDVIEDIHARYLDAGADCIETNTFGANLIVQGEYDMSERVYEMNVVAAKLARDAARSFTDRPRWVVGSMGPGTQLPSLGNTTFDALEESYGVQARGLLEGGVDALLIETSYDLLQLKAAIAAVAGAFASHGARVPLMLQVTIQPEGTMLLGSEIGAAVAVAHAFDIVDSLGINCATGPLEMIEHVRYLCQNSPKFISVQPNAGLPEMRDGRAHYVLEPAEFVRHHEIFVNEFGVNAVGGCCGTTPEYIAALASSLGGRARPERTVLAEPACASLYAAAPFKQDTSFFVVGERCNASGSRRFRDLVDAGDWDQTVQVARAQVREGAHALDVNVDFVGRDGVTDMQQIIERFRTQVTLPLVVDSTEPEVVEAALKLIGGRPIINSINLEEGRGPDTRLERNLRSAKKYGAAVIALAIDEVGQATTADWKLRVCDALFAVAVGEFGLAPGDIIFDCLVLPVSTGLEEARRAGVETLDAIERIEKEFPDSFSSLGISNVSFGLKPAARQVLNSVFLHEAVTRGLDMAIVSPAQILPLNRIDPEALRVARDLLFDRRSDGYDPLHEFIAMFEGVSSDRAEHEREERALLPVEQRLSRRIIDGDRDGLAADLDEAMVTHPPLEIINEYLLEGMKTVGVLFASGEMQLPFVLLSAETMKAAVSHLEPFMEKVDGEAGKGTVILATVKGDVHDIGKNLVDIILTNNGYSVVNLGIKQPIGSIIEAVERENADAIGLSGLLVKSTVVMREDLEELNRRGLERYPVILGGAALTRSYVEDDLRRLYKGRVFYGRDAFEGLATMDALMAEKTGAPVVVAEPKEKRVRSTTIVPPPDTATRSDVATDVSIPVAPFIGNRIVKGLAIAEVAAYLNKVALFRGQWEFKRKKGQSAEEYQAFLDEHADPILRDLLARCAEERLLQPAVVYGYFHAQSEGNDLIVYRDAGAEPVRFSFPRQTRDRHLCIADFFRPVGAKDMDIVAFHLVTMGSAVGDAARALFAADRYQDYFYLHGLGVEMAEALAELWHQRIRSELGVGVEDATSPEGLFDQGYRGSRYSFGYPACPNLEDQRQLFDLLEPERIGVTLSEEFQLDPEQSTSAIIVHHPEAKYFSVGRQKV